MPSFSSERSQTGPPLRLAAHSYSFRDLELDQALSEIARLGFSFAEVWLGHLRSVERAARLLDELGLRAVAVGVGGFYAVEDDPRPGFEAARALGAPTLVACVAPQLLAAVAAHSGDGVRLCVENHWDQPLATPRALGGLPPTVSICLDTGHALLAGVDPARFARRAGARLGHVHLKDARTPSVVERALGRRLRRRLLARPEPLRPGDGRLDVRRLRQALADVAYEGSITVEHEGDDAAGALQALRAAWESAAVE